jgi:2-polyprenyl-6-methoxyphenol hydroxylase-like FAD-dependent oxidoreductase
MASIHREITLATEAAHTWPVLRDPLGVARLFAGVLVDARLEGRERIVTFANGSIAREWIIALDDKKMRIAYTVCGGRFSHHHASMQLVPLPDNRCRFVWISDFQPDELREVVEPLVDAGCAALVRNLAS